MKAKKSFGQHFLNDKSIAQRIVNIVPGEASVLEIGPGKGALTKYLLEKFSEFKVVELDRDMVSYLREHFTIREDQIIANNFLSLKLGQIFPQPFWVIGNLPYNISSQIVFKLIEERDTVAGMVGMFQKEVAQRIAAKHGSKTYGILSVLTQLYFEVEYLFTVSEHVFQPPPKVKSAVIKFLPHSSPIANFDYSMMRSVVKMSFNQRRKMLRNSLKIYYQKSSISDHPIWTKRPEQISLDDYIFLCRQVQSDQSA